MADDLTPNDELVTAKPPARKPRPVRDLHAETVKRIRPESCGPGFKVERRPSLDDYDNR